MDDNYGCIPNVAPSPLCSIRMIYFKSYFCLLYPRTSPILLIEILLILVQMV